MTPDTGLPLRAVMLIQSVEERAEQRRERAPIDETHPASRAAQRLAAFGRLLRAAVNDELTRLGEARLSTRGVRRR